MERLTAKNFAIRALLLTGWAIALLIGVHQFIDVAISFKSILGAMLVVFALRGKK